MSPEQTFVAILVAGLLSFGGLGSLPVLRDQLSSAGLSADALVLNAVAVGNISPGPNGLYLVAVGYFVGGPWSALAAAAALMLPPLLIFPLERARTWLIHLRRFRAVLRSLGLAVVATLAVSSGSLVLHAARTPLGVAMTVTGLVLLLCRVPPLVSVAVGIIAGLLVG